VRKKAIHGKRADAVARAMPGAICLGDAISDVGLLGRSSGPTVVIYTEEKAPQSIECLAPYALRGIRMLRPMGKLHMSPVGHDCQSDSAGPVSWRTRPDKRRDSWSRQATLLGGSE